MRDFILSPLARQDLNDIRVTLQKMTLMPLTACVTKSMKPSCA